MAPPRPGATRCRCEAGFAPVPAPEGRECEGCYAWRSVRATQPYDGTDEFRAGRDGPGVALSRPAAVAPCGPTGDGNHDGTSVARRQGDEDPGRVALQGAARERLLAQ